VPGISFICDFKRDLEENRPLIDQSLNSLIHTERYQSKTLLAERSYFLGSTAYSEYPIHTFENEEYFICIEGKIYEEDDLNSRLLELAGHVFQKQTFAKNNVARWLLSTDGDFIVFILHKSSNEIVIVNDALARLPLYYFIQDDKIIISREIRFITSLLDDIRYDRMGIALFLLFGFTAGKRTLFDGISYLLPGTLIRVNSKDLKIEVDNINEFDFEKMADESYVSKYAANDLADSFRLACRKRCGEQANNILALSGGLDSRAVAAGLASNGVSVVAATRISPDAREVLDVRLAEQVADKLKLKWELIKTTSPSGNELLTLLKMKSGMNSLGMSFMLNFLEKIRANYGSDAVYFTGDGGDRIKPHIKISRKLRNINDLVNYIICNNQLFTSEQIYVLTGIKKEDIFEEIKNTVLSYPEVCLRHKYIHFMIYESALKWVFEGEDRNRYYLWSVTPFYSIHFFKKAMCCSEKSKAYYDLYRRFLLKLNPEVSSIDNAGWKLPITSIKLVPYLFLKSVYARLPEKIKNAVKIFIKGKKPIRHNPEFIRCLQEQANSHIVSDYFSSFELKQLLKDVNSYSVSTIYNLFTITSTIEYFGTGKSSLEKYYDSAFIRSKNSRT
jgi:asparagine synthase (glutamine-hydrolysing)